MKGVSLFVSALIHLCGGAFLGWGFIHPAEFMSAAPAPSLAVSLIDSQPISPPAVAEPQPEPPKIEEAPPIRKEIPKKIVKRNVEPTPQHVEPQQEAPAALTVPNTADSQGSASNSVLVRASPDYLRNPPPVYPVECRRKGEEGLVLLTVAISADGLPTQVEIKESSHSRLLDDSALKAVRGWKFKPASMAGLPVASQVDVPIRFSLRNAVN